ncbi:uncharacterized protein PG998_013297 [Apiospora kogelbergensis]|uniref:uncharacterized protein n=1 Tax=Apiospora kogelbergensis TaxID=1337665 RepID=UPI0031320484
MDSAGAKSSVSRDMEELTQGKEDISHSVQGHKANLANPIQGEQQEGHRLVGGDAAHYGDQDQPRTKTAAENIDGSRAMLQ